MKWGLVFKAFKEVGKFVAQHPEVVIAIVSAATPEKPKEKPANGPA